MALGKRIFGKSKEDRLLAKSLKNVLGFSPGKLSFYVHAFTHSSHNMLPTANNERLEFLGDAFIGSIVGEFLFKKYPNKGEGYLTEMRSRIVSRTSLNDIALRMGLQKLLRFNQQDRALRRSNIYGNALEALVGAIYLDKGYEKTQKFILKNLIRNFVDVDDLEATEYNFKNKLIIWGQQNGKQIDFVTLGETFEAGRRVFRMAVHVDEKEIVTATGYNKKQASQSAAEKAFLMLTSEATSP